MRTKIFHLSTKAKASSICIIAAAAATAAGLTVQSLHPNFLSLSPDFSPFPSEFSRRISATLDGFVRASRAVSTIAYIAVDYKYSLHGLPAGPKEYRKKLSEVHSRSAHRLLQLCECNKGFYVKAGQFAAALRQVPKEYSSVLSSLLDQAVPCDFDIIKDVLTRNLQEELSEIFLSLDEKPIAAASIAQVHRARLKNYQEVAVKVQYPGLEHQMKLDIATMSLLSRSIEWLFPEYRFDWLVTEFSETISAELDFIQEAKNSERTARNFRNSKLVKVPQIYWELTTGQVLTMQFCSGIKVDDVDALNEFGISHRKVAKALVEVFAEMIFIHGFLHGDPHPGNILVSPESQKGFSLVILDHGIYKQIDEGFRQDYCQLWRALILLDSKKIQQLCERFGVGKYSRYFPLIFTGRTIDSKSPIGKGMSVEEKKNLKKEVRSLTVDDYSSFMESLPPDLLTILRTDGILRFILNKLEAPPKMRLLTYAKYASRGLYVKSNSESDFVVNALFSRIIADVSYVQLRFIIRLVQLICSVENAKQYLYLRCKMIWGVCGSYVTGLIFRF